MKILSVNNAYLPDKGGFSHRSMKLYENFSKTGHEVYIISPTKINDSYFDSTYFLEKNIIIYRKRKKLPTFLKILKLLRNNDFDIIITHNFFWWFLISIVFPKSNLVNEIHSIKLYKNKILKLLQENIIKYWLSKKTSLSFVLSKEAKRIMVDHYNFDNEKVIFTPNGYENDKVSSPLKLKKREFVIGYAGTLYEWQGVMNIVNNAENILAIDENIRIHIVGGGPLYQKIKKIIEKKSLNDKILTTGFLEKKDYQRHIEKFDIFVIPRDKNLLTNTAIPLKIFDAIKNKIPIIMSDAKGLTEILDDNSALIYSSDTQGQIVDKCKILIENKELRLKLIRNASNKLKSWPTFEDIARAQLNYMSKII